MFNLIDLFYLNIYIISLNMIIYKQYQTSFHQKSYQTFLRSSLCLKNKFTTDYISDLNLKFFFDMSNLVITKFSSTRSIFTYVPSIR